MKILIVEDDPDSRLVLKINLQSAGHEVVEAVHGEDALEKACLSVPDLIISDILMPVMDGYKLCYEVKNDKLLRKVPFVFYTATYTDIEDERLASGLGASRFILKPTDPQKFLTIIDELIDEVQNNEVPVPEEPIDETLSLFRKFDASLSRKLVDKVRELELYRRVFENSIEAIAVVNREGHIVRQNPAHRDLFGYSEEELWGKTPAIYLPIEEIEIITDKIASDGVAAGESIATLKDSTTIFVGYSIFPVKNERNEISSYVWLMRDITRRKDAEKKQGEEREKLEIITQCIGAGLAQISPQYTTMWANNVLKDTFGDVEGKPCFKTYNQKEEICLNCGAREIFENNKDEVIHEQMGKSAKGKTVWSQIISTPVRNESGEITSVLEVVIDITAKKESEEKLRKAHEEWEKTFNAISDVVTIQDINHRIIRANDAACNIFSVPYEEIIGRHCYEFFAGIDEPCNGCPIPTAVENFLPYTAEMHHSKLNKTFEVSALPIYGDDSSVEGIAHFAKDITEQKKLEEQYRQAQKLEAIGRLSGGVAHDFNNLLTLILGYSEIAMKQLPEESLLRDDIKQIHLAGERAASLTRQLLAFSRKQILEMRVIDLNGTIENLSKMLTRLISENVDLQIVLNAEKALIYADSGQIEQVIMNLTVNCSDAMPDGGSLLIKTEIVAVDEQFVRMHEELQMGSHVIITVADTGQGILPENIDKIFEPFFTTKEMGKGTGLGLATVYGIVKQHQGIISVYSEVGKGTTFKIYLPLTEKNVEKSPDRGGKVEMLHKGTETILVVDDDEMVCTMLQSALKKLGYRVFIAGDAERAIKFMEGYDDIVHMLLTDVVMPGKSGIDLAEIFTNKLPDMKVVLMSGYAEEIVDKKNLIRPGYYFIEKPIIPSLLAFKLRSVFDGD